jgi:glycosyltransferase involved in cell wall biosynthesis
VVIVPSLYLLEAMRYYRSDINLIPNALDINFYPFIQRVSPRPILIWLRAFHEVYNPELAIWVLDIIRKDYPDGRLIMVGPDKGDGSFQRTKQLVIERGLEGVVEFPGRVPKSEVPIWLNKGDIFINTTNCDNTPISVMEAMACGLCVVSTNVGGLPHLINNGRDGILVNPNDPAEMAAVVQRLLTEPSLAEKLSCHGRQKVEQFDWAKILPIWEDLFSTVGKNV